MFLQDPTIKGFNTPSKKQKSDVKAKDILNIPGKNTNTPSTSSTSILPLVAIASIGGFLMFNK